MKQMFFRKVFRCLLVRLGVIVEPAYVVRVEARQPGAAQMVGGEIIAVMGATAPKWACFLCPCGSGEVVRLSIDQHSRPTWFLHVDVLGRPTLHPSVWQLDGCLCHFWIRKGEVSYCAA